jgi:hypothetical protein
MTNRAEVNAMTRTELSHFLEDHPAFLLGADKIRLMTHAQMEEATWLLMIADGEANVEEKAPTAAQTAVKPNTKGKLCACGCGETTKGGTWMPGHDAIFHAREKNGGMLVKEGKMCKCGCGGMTKGGTFRPGHDTRYYSKLHKTASIGLDVKAPHVGKAASRRSRKILGGGQPPPFTQS